ncbi:MAG: hypothetical protein HYX59_03225 [Elusimicrobia bacterium]|nr:hypothetical protein [Elusimicrobiota bacterium]
MRLLALAVLLSACSEVPTRMSFVADPGACLPGMSSTIGIGITPAAEPPPGVTVRYRWHASRGNLKTYSDVTHETVVFGADAVTTTEKLYWACDAAGIAAGDPVVVTIVTENAKNGEELVRADIRIVSDGEKMRVAR